MRFQKIKWAFVFLVSLVGLYIGYDQGIHNMIIENDQSYLSWVIMVMWAFSSLSVGRRLFANNWEEWPDLHFSSGAMVKLGMIGTVIGFLFTMSGAFVDLDPTNLETFRSVLSHMGTGVSTALWTTLVGLVFSLNLEIQLIVSES